MLIACAANGNIDVIVLAMSNIWQWLKVIEIFLIDVDELFTLANVLVTVSLFLE